MSLLAVLVAGCSDLATPAGETGLRVVGLAEDGASLGCRITLTGLGDTPSPVWGHDVEGQVGEWLSPDAVAVDNTVVSSACAIDIPVDAGVYHVTVSHGLEWEELSVDVTVGTHEMTNVEATLARAVDSSGWVCLDAHVHSAPSFDCDVPLDQRLVGAVAEGLDAIIPTDHNAVVDWEPELAAAELRDRLVVIPGDEITPELWGSGDAIGHFNLYPVPEDFDPESVAVRGGDAAALVRAVRAAVPDALLQINHPRWNGTIGYFAGIGFDPATLTGLDAEVIGDVQTLEVWNGHELDRPEGSALEENLVDWYALLRAGYSLIGVANSDTHRLARSPVGTPRTCVALEGDGSTVTVDAILDALRAGRAFGTSGPWIELDVGGRTVGNMVQGGTQTVRVDVQAAGWVDVDMVTLVIDGAAVDSESVASVPSFVSFDVTLASDGWLLALAEGDEPLSVEAGEHALPMRSFAFTNPVYVDADGDGLWTPH